MSGHCGVSSATLNVVSAKAQWQERAVPIRALAQLQQDGIDPILAKVLAARGITQAAQIDPQLDQLLNPKGLAQINEAAQLIIKAITRQQSILIVADYDCDGATACAVAIRGLVLLGALPQQIQYLVPDRIKFGYGLSPELAVIALQRQPQLVITVDNGISSIEGVQLLRDAGCEVLVTDHHLAGEQLAPASAIVNPNQPGCGFQSKALAGVGTLFYVLLATRAQMRDMQIAGGNAALQTLLDLVAIGTVADLVPLDLNNRILVNAGIKRIRAGQTQVGIKALLSIAGKPPPSVSARDIGFTIGPRINAAGRLDDMAVGIELLITDDPARAAELTEALENINQERKQVQADMLEQAQLPSVTPLSHCLVVANEQWHQGVVGLVASRLKDQWHLPVLALAPAGNSAREWRGSGRSVPGVHLRDCLDWVAKKYPQMMTRFGGHAMAAGVTVRENAATELGPALNAAIVALHGAQSLTQTSWHDGRLTGNDLTLELAILLTQIHWGQRFDPPQFCVDAEIIDQTIVKAKHVSCRLKVDGKTFRGIRFFCADLLPRQTSLIVSLMAEEFRGQRDLTLNIAAIA